MDNESQLIAEAMKTNPRIIAVDLDGTLASDKDGWKGFGYIGEPNLAVVSILASEKARGSRIILHTCRVTTLDNKINAESLDTIRAWLAMHKVPVDEIWMSVGKPWATVYIDDKAVHPECSGCAARFASSIDAPAK